MKLSDPFARCVENSIMKLRTVLSRAVLMLTTHRALLSAQQLIRSRWQGISGLYPR